MQTVCHPFSPESDQLQTILPAQCLLELVLSLILMMSNFVQSSDVSDRIQIQIRIWIWIGDDYECAWLRFNFLQSNVRLQFQKSTIGSIPELCDHSLLFQPSPGTRFREECKFKDSYKKTPLKTTWNSKLANQSNISIQFNFVQATQRSDDSRRQVIQLSTALGDVGRIKWAKQGEKLIFAPCSTAAAP